MGPPSLTYAQNTYLTLSTRSDPAQLVAAASSDEDSPIEGDLSRSHFSQASSGSSQSQSSGSQDLKSELAYVGPVGALRSEHILSLPVPSSSRTGEVEQVRKWLEGRDGVSNVQVMVPQKRVKKSFDC